MSEYQSENQDNWQDEATGICSTCSQIVADIFKDVYLREIAKIEFQPADGGLVLTGPDWDQMWKAAERAQEVALIGLDYYQQALRRIAEQEECD